MKKFYFVLAMVAVAVTSCQKEYVSNEEQYDDAVEDKVSTYAISEEEALERLELELSNIYGETTRSSARRVRSISSVKYNDVVPATRSNEDLDVDNLLYVVEFEDGQGSAVLGADERLNNVFAVLDQGVISQENFRDGLNGNTNEIDNYLAALIVDEAVSQLSNPTLPSIPDIPDIPLRYAIDVVDTLTNERAECFINTKWSQDEPFNNLCYNSSGVKCPAGDVTIAAAQILMKTYIRPSNNGRQFIHIGDETFNLTTLKQKLPGVMMMEPYKTQIDEEVARYVYAIADYLNITLTPTRSYGVLENLMWIFEDLGYTNMSYKENIDFLDDVLPQVVVSQLPAPIRGEDIYGAGHHSWIIDACIYTHCAKYRHTYEGTTFLYSEFVGYDTVKKVHCNFGFGGYCDGYYEFGIFDVNETLNSEDILTNIGDKSGTRPYELNNHLAMIKYLNY